MSLASRLIKAIFATEAGVLTAANSPAEDDNSKKIATTEWAAFGFVIVKATPGYIKFPTWLGGLIIQWGTFNPSMNKSASQGIETYQGGGSFNYLIEFPTSVAHVNVMPGDHGTFGIEYANVASKNKTGFSTTCGGIPNSAGGPATYVINGYTWIAIGW